MTNEVHVEFAGLTAEAVRLIEGLRQSPSDTKSQILVRALTPLQKNAAPAKPATPDREYVDYKEGIHLYVGEKVYLFLTRSAKHAGKPDAEAEVRKNGLLMDGKLIPPSHGRPFQPAMEIVQKRKKHFSEAHGGTVSLSAIRKWCVLRDGKYLTLNELKDPALRRTRGRTVDINLEELEL